MKTIALMDGDQKVTFTTKQYGNGSSIDCSHEIQGLWTATFDDEAVWHTGFREKLVKEGSKIIGGDIIEDAINPPKSKFKKIDG